MWLNWTAFVYAGLRARHRRWVMWGVAYLAVSATSLALIGVAPDEHWLQDAGALIGLFSWGVSLVHALAVRRDFLDRVEALDDPRLDEAEDRLARRDVALDLVAGDPMRARELGIGRPDIAGAYEAGLVDLNHAPAGVIALLPGFDDQLARRVVEVRDEIDGFSSLDDFGHVLDLPAPVTDRLREIAIFLPR